MTKLRADRDHALWPDDSPSTWLRSLEAGYAIQAL